MKVLLLCTLILLSTFPLYKNPISLGGVLVLISFCLVSLASLFSSWWYAYVLFLVYIGGLLVMFIYVCLVSSNYPFFVNPNQIVLLLSVSLGGCYVMSLKPVTLSFLGGELWDSGSGLVYDNSLSLFVGLVVLLLLMLLVVVRSSGAGAVIVSGE
uniref:NADH dehydrogenase subunit 6 n=1 Tax=Dolabella auricularia TaxID=6511 RepID=A0A343R5P5_DOLAU|nr:NADH dehydrogenase subunit 6 [Dolabella auricularia]